MHRVVAPEILDELPSHDPGAIRSRADLRRLNGIMGHAGIFTRALRGRLPAGRPLQVVELGAGDGVLMLELARRWSALGVKAAVTLVDRRCVVTDETRRAFQALGWSVELSEADVFAWLESHPDRADLVLCNLFLHHFDPQPLSRLLALIAGRTDCFAACEPRRAWLALSASRLLGLIGCHAVTRHDAVVSVRAGFRADELSARWPDSVGWRLTERAAGLFSHCFVGVRHG